MARVRTHRGRVEGLWRNAQHIVYEYSGRPVLRVIGGRPYRLVAFYQSDWTFPLVVDEYVSSKANPSEYRIADLTGALSGTTTAYADDAVGNLPTTGYPAKLLEHIGGIWRAYGASSRLSAAKRVVKSSRRGRKKRAQPAIMRRVRG